MGLTSASSASPGASSRTGLLPPLHPCPRPLASPSLWAQGPETKAMGLRQRGLSAHFYRESSQPAS